MITVLKPRVAVAQLGWNNPTNALTENGLLSTQDPGTAGWLKLWNWDGWIPDVDDIRGLEVMVVHSQFDTTQDEFLPPDALDFMFILDYSGSMNLLMSDGRTRMRWAKDFSIATIDELQVSQPTSRAAAVSFDRDVTPDPGYRIISNFTNDIDTFRSLVLASTEIGTNGTFMKEGIQLAIDTVIATHTNPPSFVLVTDGQWTTGDPTTEVATMKAAHPDWKFFVVYIHSDASLPTEEAFCQNLGEVVGDGYYKIDGSSVDFTFPIDMVLQIPPPRDKSRLAIRLGTGDDYTPSSDFRIINADYFTHIVSTKVGDPNFTFGYVGLKGRDINNSVSILLNRSTISDENLANDREIDTAYLIVYHTVPGGSFSMSEQESVRLGAHVAPEVIPGTAVAPTRKLRSIVVVPTPNPTFKEWTPQSEKLPSNELLTQEWATSAVSGLATYDEGPFLVHNGMAKINSSVVDGRSIHTARFDNRGEQKPGSLTCVYGEKVTACHRARYFQFPDLSFEMRRDDIVVGGSATAKAIEYPITLTGGVNDDQTLTITATGGTYRLAHAGQFTAPLAFGANAAAIATALNALAGISADGGAVHVTGAGPFVIAFDTGALAGNLQPRLYVETKNLTGGTATVDHTTTGGFDEFDLIPVMPGDINIYLSDTYDTLSSNKMTRATMAGFNMRSRFSMFWTLNKALGVSFAGTKEDKPNMAFSLQAHRDSEVMSLLPDYRTDKQVFMRMECISDIEIIPGFPHMWTIDAAVKVSGAGPMQDANGMFVMDYALTATENKDWGNSVVMTWENGVLGSDYTG